MAEVLFKVGDKVRLKAPYGYLPKGHEGLVEKDQYLSHLTGKLAIDFLDQTENKVYRSVLAERFEMVEHAPVFSPGDNARFTQKDTTCFRSGITLKTGDIVLVKKYEPYNRTVHFDMHTTRWVMDSRQFEKVEPMSEFAKGDVLEYIQDHAYSNAHTGIRKGDKIVVDSVILRTGPNAGIPEGSVAFNIAANSWELPAKYFKKATIDTFEVGDLARYRFDYESRIGNYIKKGDLVKIVAINDLDKSVTICFDRINYCYYNFAFDKITKDTPDETFAPGDLIEYWGPPNNFGLNHDSEVEFKPLRFKEWISVKSVHLDSNTGRLVINFTKDGIPRSYFAHDFMMAPIQVKSEQSPIMQVGYNVTPETNKESAMYQIDLKDLPEGVTADQFVEKMKQEFMKRKPSDGTTRKEPPAWLLGIVTFITTVLTGLAYQYFTK